MINPFFMFFLFCIIPNQDIPIDNVDTIEINHYYDDSGHHVFDQLIFWNNNTRKDMGYQEIVEWKMCKDVRLNCTEKEKDEIKKNCKLLGVEQPNSFTKWNGYDSLYYDYSKRKYVLMLKDGENIRVIIGNSFCQSWTQYDREVDFRKFQSKENRIGLSK